MRTISAYILSVLFVFQWPDCYGQETISVSKPVLEIQGENLIINYDILNDKPGQKYSISIEISDSGGRIITPQSFSGDIGDSINGGKGKKITWHYITDNVKDEVDISINIILKFHKETLAELIPSSGRTFGRGSLMLQSVALPGLGLSKIYNNKPYWIMGIAGYGIISSSVIFHGASRASYQDFLDTNDPEQEDLYYKKYQSQNTISMVSAIGAAALWITDLILVYRASSNQKNPLKVDQNKRLSLLPDYDLRYNAPAFKIRYTF